jgi:hypothetical protein
MGFMDKIKGLFKGRKREVKTGIDTASDQVEKRVGPEHATKVEAVADKAKDTVDKLAGDEPTGTPSAAATPSAPSATSSAPATPSAPSTSAPPSAEPAGPPTEPPAAPPS